MTSILLIISFLMHLVLLAVVYHLYQQIQEMKAERSQETELLLSRFLDEIKKENRQLQYQLQSRSSRLDPEEKMSATSQQPSPIQRGPKNVAPFFNTKDAKSDFPPVMTKKADEVETSSKSRIFQLHREGMPTGEIAKQLNCGKTEVELLLKVHSHN